MNIITKKFRKFRDMLSRGQYGRIVSRVLLNIFGSELLRNPIYFMLSQKYRPFIQAHVSANLPKTGGGS